MVRQGGGAIVSTASISGLVGLPAQAFVTGAVLNVDGGFTVA